MDNIKELRRLVIKTFHIDKVEYGDKTYIYNGILYLRKNIIKEIFDSNDVKFIKELTVSIIGPNEKNIFVNSILDFIPIATKVLGNMGEGITHTLTGTYGMITSCDEDGIQVAEFGSSEGILKEQVVFDRRGTPSDNDILIHFDVILKSGQGTNREAIFEIHKTCDLVIQEIRDVLKKMNGRYADEKYEYFDKIRQGKKKVVIVKQVAGQGAMYDTALFPKEPSGVNGSISIIDMNNVPIILTPNEYRDGALRAMH